MQGQKERRWLREAFKSARVRTTVMLLLNVLLFIEKAQMTACIEVIEDDCQQQSSKKTEEICQLG